MTLVLAHRGLHRGHGENSLNSFVAARELGLDGVELDVRQSRDGALVVHHDPDLAGRAIVDASTSDLTGLAELAAALAACGPLRVNVEVKTDAYAPGDRRREGFVAAVLDAVGGRAGVIYSSFDLTACVDLAARSPVTPVGWLLSVGVDVAAALESARHAGLSALHPHFSGVNATLVQRAHAAGLAVNAWTPNEDGDLTRMFEAGVDAVITDEPERARLLLGKA